MAVSHLEVTRRTPFAADYERVDGKLHFAVDPGQPANTRIVDLDKAPRDAAGKVRFWADFVWLQPAQRARSNGRCTHRRAANRMRTSPTRPPTSMSQTLSSPSVIRVVGRAR